MSHGGGVGGEVKAEPNLTPLLDVVMQLIMFFMVGVSFVADQVKEGIDLPVSQSARPLEKGLTDTLFLNMNKDGAVEVVDRPQPMKTPEELLFYLKGKYADYQEFNKGGGGKGEVNTVVILRADKSVSYKELFTALEKCKSAGFTKLHIRAKTTT